MHDSTTPIHLVLSLTIDPAGLAGADDVSCAASATITFSHEAEGIRCDGELSLLLSLLD